MSRPMVTIRNPALPLAPIPESSQVHFTPPPPQALPPTAPSAPPSDAMAYPTPMIGGMPPQFWCTPPHAACAFSTQGGRYPTRQLPTNEPYPPPVMRTNLNHDVQKKAAQLARQFPELARGITPITDWYHLYRYWDAVDLWIEGAAFCYFVIHRIGMVNKELDDEFFFTIDEFAKEWIAGHEELVVNNLQVGNLTELFDDLDRSNFTGMTRTEIKLLTDRLNHHRHFLLSHVQELRRQAAPYPRIIERGPAGMMMGPYPGHMYPISPQNFPHGPSMIDPQRAAQGVPSSPKPPHQTYNQFVENQRNLASRYGPRVPPNNVRNENRTMGAGAEARARGWSNDTARNGRTNNSWNNRNGRPYVPATPQPSPPRPMGSAEPIYVFTSQNTSPQNQQPSQRIFSDPVPVNVHNPNPQRAFSDSPAGPGTFDSIDATPLGRRASTNDAGSRPNYIPENMVSPQEQRTTRSARSTPRAPLINDARVLAAMEKQAGPGFGNKQSLARAAAVQPRPLAQAAADTVRPNIELQTTTGAGGPIHTYHYSSSPHRLSYSEQCNRSVFVGNAPYDLFVDHALKEFLSQCGEVDNIQYLPQRGHAFVAFVDENSVQLAVQRLDGQLFGGVQLVVNLPKPRSRGDSYSSQRGYSSSRTAVGPKDIEHGAPFSRYNRHSRNFSRNSDDAPHHIRKFSRQSNDGLISPPRIEARLIASVSEVIQHNAALNRMGPPMPLGSIENTYGRDLQTKPNHEYRYSGDSSSQTGQHNRKENSPMKSDRPPMTPSRKSSFSSQAGGQGSKRKQNKRAQISRQNSSTSAAARPTPAVTPTKSRPAGILTGPIQEATSATKPSKEATSTMPAETHTQLETSEDVVAEKPKSKSKKYQKKKKNTYKSEGENSTAASSSNNNTSFATESSADNFEITSPICTESSMGFTSNSTSFSSLPSRKPSVVSSVSTPPMSEAPEENDSFSTKAMSPKITEVDEKSITPKPSQTQLFSKSPDTAVKQRSVSEKTHSKKESVVSATSIASSSLRKADANPAKSDGEAESPEAKIHLDDQKEFPALGPIKSSISAIADGKRPAAHVATQRPLVIGSSNERVVSGTAKTQVKPAVPIVAVPRSYMQRQASQPALRVTEKRIDLSGLTKDGLGSRTWPFVKRVKAL